MNQTSTVIGHERRYYGSLDWRSFEYTTDVPCPVCDASIGVGCFAFGRDGGNPQTAWFCQGRRRNWQQRDYSAVTDRKFNSSTNNSSLYG